MTQTKTLGVYWLLLFQFLGFTSLSAQSVEQEIVDCLKKAFQARDKSYVKTIEVFEQNLIAAGQLKDASGKSYLEMINTIKVQNDLRPLLLPIDTILISETVSLPCFMVESSKLSGSPKKFATILDSLYARANSSPAMKMDLLINNFSENDLESTLGKHFFIYFALEDLFNFKGVGIALPSWTETEPNADDIKPRNILTVLVDGKNDIYVRGRRTKMKKLKAIVKKFISNPKGKEKFAEDPTKAIIALKNQRETLYKTYLDVYKELRAAYEELWNELCLKKYGIPYSKDLAPEILKEIRNAIPFAISESEPG